MPKSLLAHCPRTVRLSAIRLPFSLVVPPRFQLLALALLLHAGISLATRLALTMQSWSQIDHSPLTLLTIFGIGLFYDLASGLYLAIPLALYLLVTPRRLLQSRWHRLVLYPAFFAFIYALGFLAMAEWLFWDEFGVRFNFIAVDYLVYTHEVIGNITESYPIPKLLTGIGIVSALLFLVLRPRLERIVAKERLAADDVARLRQRTVAAFVFLLLPLLAFFGVSSPADAAVRNRYEKELAENGLYQLFAAFRGNSLDYRTFYLNIDDKTALASLRPLLRQGNSRFAGQKPEELTRIVTGTGAEERPNVVFVMVESLSAEYLGSFGNQEGLTPNLDRIARQGLLFKNLYATGTRTVRGMEAVTLSEPPTPGQAIVRRPNNDHLFSLGYLFKERGYDTKFLYGGFGYFDNMNAYFGGNGFQVIDRSDLQSNEITFANIWGVCDEDLYGRALKEFDASHAQGKPFLGYLMTTSNHRPFTYPDGKIDIPSHTGRNGGVKYTDYAINRFIEEARQHPWFTNTVFVIVADHCAGSAGSQELPVHRYHIPLLFYAPNRIAPGVNTKLASQIDVVPTLLGLLQWRYKTKLFGQDILRPDFTPRAFISTYQRLGYLRNGYLTILNERQSVNQYRIKEEGMQNSVLEKVAEQPELTQEAICYYQGASLANSKRLNRWDK